LPLDRMSAFLLRALLACIRAAGAAIEHVRRAAASVPFGIVLVFAILVAYAVVSYVHSVRPPRRRKHE
jgi:hypothetical protein